MGFHWILCVTLGKSPTEIKPGLTSVYRKTAFNFKKSSISKWINWFKGGQLTVKDDHKNRHPATSVMENKITVLKKCAKEEYRRVTVWEVAETFNTSYGSTQEILTSKLVIKHGVTGDILHGNS